MEQTLLFVEAVMILGLSSSLLLILLCTFCDHKKDSLYKCFFVILIISSLLSLICIICQSVFLRRIIDYDLSYDCSDKITNEILRKENLNLKESIKYIAVNLGLDCFYILFNLIGFLIFIILVIIEEIKFSRYMAKDKNLTVYNNNDLEHNKNNVEGRNKENAKEVIVDNGTLTIVNQSDKLADNNNISSKDANNNPNASQE